LATIGGIGIGLAAVFAPNLLNQFMSSLTGLDVKTSQAITGDASHFDPFKSYAEAHDFAAKDAQLVGLTAYYVKSDGTQDLTATYSPAPRTEYKFVEEVPAPTNAPPIGAGGSATAKWYKPIVITAYRPGQSESIREYSGNTSLQYTFVNKGYSRETSDVRNNAVTILAPPACDLAQMWKTAIQTANAQPNAVATITYSTSGYRFEITGTNVSLTFGIDCNVTAS
jgi:hypothetical protein